MELPFHLKTLEPLPGALDILRYFGDLDGESADADQICEDLDMSDRRFSKAIRRLVTKEYLSMEGDMVYRLTRLGNQAVEELRDYDEATGGIKQVVAPRKVDVVSTRRLVVAVPKSVAPHSDSHIVVGFHPGDNGGLASADVVVRVSATDGYPESPEDVLFSLTTTYVQEPVAIKTTSSALRLKFEVYQLGEMGDIQPIGGMRVDVPVGKADSGFIAYGTDVKIASL
ncbi:MAG: hypothetical protein MUE54_06530 [Anaerolineae bacterium]|nr:hypothetical protein [Anaerolineae bacterium]